ncbi:MAG: fructosamine kinase family protein [Pseudomonadales bacterium]|nr:fructosamine kinase family protein [Pseudomonadales bacterium]MCP5171597.1 fructosamine kinase family protein [Pseudomonadales bacterium]
MPRPNNMRAEIEHLLDDQITKLIPVNGGDITRSFILKTVAKGTFFVKSLPDAPQNMFSTEAIGLAALGDTGEIATPAVIAAGTEWLILEYIETSPPTTAFWELFARQLGRLHRIPQPDFGFEVNNYCGKTPQINTITSSGHEFFAKQRIGFQADLSLRKGLLSTDDRRLIDNLASRLRNLIPEQAPSLIHGDLWPGNHLCSNKGTPVLIDPSTHRGWAEAEIAMTTLFGGFPESFYQAYLEANPLNPGWQERLPLYNLYHLLNHLNLFGSSYHSRVMDIVKRYS